MPPIRVGIIGANPDKGWGSSVHVPVIACQNGFDLTAVCTTRMESAKISAERFGARHAFDKPADLIGHPDVDLVVIAVKAPDHYGLALNALNEGKHVYCEWPLAATVGQASEMAELAGRQGVQTMVGLQSRGSPNLRYMRQLIQQGYVGRVVAARLNCALPGGGRRRSEQGQYVIRRESGAGTFAIQGGHAIDALQFCVGKITNLVSLVANQFPEVEIIETGKRLAKDAPDQILCSGWTEEGAVVSIAINGGVVAGHGIALDVFGEQGTLSVRGDSGLGFQMSETQLVGAQAPERKLAPIDPGFDDEVSAVPIDLEGRQPYPGVEVPRATLVNVANLYRELARAIESGDQPIPSFKEGLELHNLLDRIEAQACTANGAGSPSN